MFEIDVSDEDRTTVREVYCYAACRFCEGNAFELAAQALRARHWGTSLRDALSVVLRIIGEVGDPCGDSCGCQGGCVDGSGARRNAPKTSRPC